MFFSKISEGLSRIKSKEDWLNVVRKGFSLGCNSTNLYAPVVKYAIHLHQQYCTKLKTMPNYLCHMPKRGVHNSTKSTDKIMVKLDPSFDLSFPFFSLPSILVCLPFFSEQSLCLSLSNVSRLLGRLYGQLKVSKVDWKDLFHKKVDRKHTHG